MKGICFKEFMFKAVVYGVKTTTCRLADISLESRINDKGNWNILFRPSKYRRGEIVYLKEPYSDDIAIDRTFYKYDAFNDEHRIAHIENPWKNKLFMPESAARFFIKVNDVKLIDLKQIDDFAAEGIQVDALGYHYGTDKRFPTEKEAFIDLWDAINGKGAYDSNPKVWMYRFELLHLLPELC